MNLRQLGAPVPPFHFLGYNPNHKSVELPSGEEQRAHRVTVTSSRSAMTGGVGLVAD